MPTVAGGQFPGFRDGPGDAARFRAPSDVLIDEKEFIYVSDTFNNRIRRIDKRGWVTTAAGSIPGDEIGQGQQARFRRPTRLRWAPDGSLLILDSGNRAIKQLDPRGNVGFVRSVPQGLLQVSDFIPIGANEWLFGDRESGRIVRVDAAGETRAFFKSDPFLWAIHEVDNDQYLSLNSFLGTGSQQLSRWTSAGTLMWSVELGEIFRRSSNDNVSFEGHLTDVLPVGPEQILTVDQLSSSIYQFSMRRPELFSIDRASGDAQEELAIKLTCPYPEVVMRHSWTRDLAVDFWNVYQAPISVPRGKTLHIIATIGSTALSEVVEVTAELP